MNRLLVAAALAANLTVLGVAQFTPAPAQAETPVQDCRIERTMAGMIMMLRQNGRPMSEMLDLHADRTDTVFAAYERPMVLTPSARQDEINLFKDRIDVQCHMAQRGR